MRPSRRSLAAALATTLALSACAVPGGGKAGRLGVAALPGGPAAAARLPEAAAGATLTGKVKLPTGFQPAPVISDQGGSLVANNGAGIVATNGGRIVAPNGSRYAAGPASGASARALAQAGDRPLAGARVVLLEADGQPALGPDGQPIMATTGPDGGYVLAGVPAGRGLIVSVPLAGDAGAAQALAPRDRAGGGAVDVDVASSVMAGFILGAYVRAGAAPQATLDKLPAAIEAEARAAAARALAGTPDAAPAALTEALAIRAVQALGRLDSAFAAQLERLRRVFVTAGLVDEGAGRPATELSLGLVDAIRLGADGSLFMASSVGDRIWRVGPDGVARTAAGRGARDAAIEGQAGPWAGLGFLMAFTTEPSGRMWLLERDRLSAMGPDGTVHEVWSGFADGRTLALRPEGGVWLLTGGGMPALWRVAADGKREQVASYTGEAATRLATATQAGVGSDGVLRFAGGKGDVAPWTCTIDPKSFAFAPVTVEAPGLAGFALDPRGNLVLYADDPGFRLWARRPDGTEVAIAEGEAPPQFAIDRDGVLLLDDGTAYAAADSEVVWRFSGGKATRVAGRLTSEGGAADQATFSRVFGVAVRSDGERAFADRGFRNLYRQRAGGPVEVWLKGCWEDGCGGDGAVGQGTMGKFYDMAYDAQDRLWLLDRDPAGAAEARLRRVARDGTVTLVHRFPEAFGPDDMFVRPDGTVYVLGGTTGADGAATRGLWRLAPGATTPERLSATIPLAPIEDFMRVAVTADGATWLLGEGVMWHAPAGGAFAEAARDERLQPGGLTLDAKDRALATTWYGAVRIDRPGGPLTPVAGPGSAALAGATVDDSVEKPYALAFGPDGDLHIADYGHDQFKAVPARLLPP